MRKNESDSEWEFAVESEGTEVNYYTKPGYISIDVSQKSFPIPTVRITGTLVNARGQRWCVPTKDWTVRSDLKSP